MITILSNVYFLFSLHNNAQYSISFVQHNLFHLNLSFALIFFFFFFFFCKQQQIYLENFKRWTSIEIRIKNKFSMFEPMLVDFDEHTIWVDSSFFYLSVFYSWCLPNLMCKSSSRENEEINFPIVIKVNID